MPTEIVLRGTRSDRRLARPTPDDAALGHHRRRASRPSTSRATPVLRALSRHARRQPPPRRRVRALSAEDPEESMQTATDNRPRWPPSRAVALALAACGGGAAEPTPAASGAPVELKVSLFGTFGYEEVGPVPPVRGARTPASRSPTSRPRARTTTGPRCRPGSAPGPASPTCRASRSARIADVATNQADQWTDLRDTPATDAIGRYIDWKEPAATTADGAVLGLGTDIGPMGICYRSDLLAQAGLPTDPTSWPRRCRPGTTTSPSARSSRPAAPAGTAWHDSAGGLYNAIISSRAGDLLRRSPASWSTTRNPAVRAAFDTAAEAGQGGLTAKLEQFSTRAGTRASPAAASPPSPARPG